MLFRSGQAIDGHTYRQANDFLDRLLRVLHPVMPFITEELWQHLAERADGESIMYAPMPEAAAVDGELLKAMEEAFDIVNGIRGVRARKNIPAREALQLKVVGSMLNPVVKPVLVKLGGVDTIEENAEKDPAATAFMVGTSEFAVPMSQNADKDAEIERITKEIDYLKGFLASVEKKLSNERFVSNAPAAVVDAERRKQADATAKLESLAASLKALS